MYISCDMISTYRFLNTMKISCSWNGIIFVSFLAESLFRHAAASRKVHGGDYCDTEVFRAECSDGEVIVLERARYGRMRLGRCVEISLGYLGCSADVITMADRRCSGKRVCEIRIPDAEFESTGPCLKELKTYLEASYTCVPVTTLTADYCNVHKELNVTQLSGYLASVVTSDIPSCLGTTHPWVIASLPGQRINLTLYDFSLDVRYSVRVNNITEQFVGVVEACRDYGTVLDSGKDPELAKTRICGGGTDQRISNLMVSTGNIVKIWVSAGTGPKDLSRFVIHYSVIGCPDPEVPEHAKFIRSSSGDGLIQCLYTPVTWSITCLPDTTWIGVVGNCSLPSAEAVDDVFIDKPHHPSISILMVALLTGIIVTISSILFIFIVLLHRRQSRRRRHKDRRIETKQLDDLMVLDPRPPPAPPSPPPTLSNDPHQPQQLHLVTSLNGVEYEHVWQAANNKVRTTGLTTFTPANGVMSRVNYT